MESSEAIIRIVRPPRRPRRPRCPESQRIYQIFEDLRKNNPELLKSELAKMKEPRIEPKPIIEDPEIRKIRRAAIFERTGPVKMVFVPQTIRDTSEAACDTEFEANMYKEVANADPREVLFKVLNPATRVPDELFTACVLKRYREDQCDSNVTVVAASDDVQGTSVFKRHREEIGESSETMVTSYADAYMKLVKGDRREMQLKVLNPVTGLPDEVLAACVLKRYRKDQCGSSVTVVAASDDVQGTSVLKCHREEIGESSETMATASDEVTAAASVLKCHREDLGESSETVVAAPGNH